MGFRSWEKGLEWPIKSLLSLQFTCCLHSTQPFSVVKGGLRWRVWVLKEGWGQQGSRLPQGAVLSSLPSDRFQKTKQEVPSHWRWLSIFSSELMSRYPQLGNRLNKGHTHTPESVCSPRRAIEWGHPDHTVLNPGILELSPTLHHCQAPHSAGKSTGAVDLVTWMSQRKNVEGKH